IGHDERACVLPLVNPLRNLVGADEAEHLHADNGECDVRDRPSDAVGAATRLGWQGRGDCNEDGTADAHDSPPGGSRRRWKIVFLRTFYADGPSPSTGPTFGDCCDRPASRHFESSNCGTVELSNVSTRVSQLPLWQPGVPC